MEKTEAERQQLLDLVRSLEIKLHSVEQSSAEEQWTWRQKSATHDAERVSFDREKTFIREKHAEEEKRLQVEIFELDFFKDYFLNMFNRRHFFRPNGPKALLFSMYHKVFCVRFSKINLKK